MALGQLYTFGQITAADPPEPSFAGGTTSRSRVKRRQSTRYPTLWHGSDLTTKLHSVISFVACGAAHCAALTDTATLLTWGEGANGRLGHGSGKSSVATPTVVDALSDYRIVSVACGGRHTACVENGGGLFTWGMASTGALGLGAQLGEQRQDVWEPQRVESMREHPVFAVDCGSAHSVALSSDGVAYSCGWRDNGRLGRKPKSLAQEARFMRVAAKGAVRGQRFVALAVGSAHTLLLSAQRRVFAFGENSVGQLGVGDKHDRSTPTEVAMLTGRKVFTLAAGDRHSVAITEKGVVYVWGNGDSGQLGLPQASSIDCVAMPQVAHAFMGLGPSMVGARMGTHAFPAACADQPVGCCVRETQASAGGSHTIITTATTPYLQGRMDMLDPIGARTRAANMKKLKLAEYAPLRAHFVFFWCGLPLTPCIVSPEPHIVSESWTSSKNATSHACDGARQGLGPPANVHRRWRPSHPASMTTAAMGGGLCSARGHPPQTSQTRLRTEFAARQQVHSHLTTTERGSRGCTKAACVAHRKAAWTLALVMPCGLVLGHH